MEAAFILSVVVVLTAIAGAQCAYFEAITCCALENQCDNCANTYYVNSMRYCCPNCVGTVQVTALVCSCRQTYSDPSLAPNCTASNQIVGGYPYWKPSYYYAASDRISAPALSVFVGFTSLAALALYRQFHLLPEY